MLTRVIWQDIGHVVLTRVIWQDIGQCCVNWSDLVQYRPVLC